MKYLITDLNPHSKQYPRAELEHIRGRLCIDSIESDKHYVDILNEDGEYHAYQNCGWLKDRFLLIPVPNEAT